jgi:hypothetical protein
LREDFVAVAADDWYQRRREDAVGEFFRGVADQGPRKGEGGATRQGRYVFTASGKLLGYNNNRGSERLRALLEDSLAAWRNLPEAERAPGAVEVPELPDGGGDRRYSRRPPEGGLVFEVHTRTLATDPGSGALAACRSLAEGGPGAMPRGSGPATDHLWVLGREWQEWLTAAAAGASPVSAPDSLALRVARFHLVDNTRGEPPHWTRDEVREIALTAEPGAGGELRVVGSFHLETRDGSRGFVGRIEGSGRLGQAGAPPADLQVVAWGDHWGEGRFTPGARPGRQPLGVVFTLADPGDPADRVPPQGARWEAGYYEP